MKTRQTIFCSIGLGVAGIAAVNLALTLLNSMSGHNYSAQVHTASYLFAIIYEVALVVCLGGGGLANLIGNRLKPGATMAMIVMFCLNINPYSHGALGDF